MSEFLVNLLKISGAFLVLAGVITLVPAFGDVWVEPTKETIDTAFGTLEYDKVPQDFVCDVTPRIQHSFVSKNNPVTYPTYDSLILRISGKNSFMDMQLETSLWKGNVTSATDLSYDISIRSTNGTRLGGGIYSPDSVSQYSTLGVVIEASDDLENGILSSDEINRLNELFGSKYVTPYAFPQGMSDFEIHVIVFDSDNDWIESDRCGVEAVIPVSVGSDYTIDVGTMEFSNVKISALETKHPTLQIVEQNDTSTENKNNQTVTVQDSMDVDGKQEQVSEKTLLTPTPKEQIESGVPPSEVECGEDLEIAFKISNGDPVCVKPATKENLLKRGWAKLA